MLEQKPSALPCDPCAPMANEISEPRGRAAVLSLSAVDATQVAIFKMVQSAATLTPREKEVFRLLALCLRYKQIFNVGDKPLTATNLLDFHLEPPSVAKPISVPPRPLSHVKREAAAKIVREGIKDGILPP